MKYYNLGKVLKPYCVEDNSIICCIFSELEFCLLNKRLFFIAAKL